MFVIVEPRDGSELDRLITALLTATGAAHQVIETTEQPPDADGEKIVGKVAERLCRTLAPMAEHYGDEELAALTGLLAHITLLVAGDLEV